LKYIRVQKIDGQKFLNFIHNHSNRNKKIIDPNYEIEHEDNFVLFPIIADNLKPVLSKLTEMHYEIVERNERLKLNPVKRSIRNYLENDLPRKILDVIPKSYDIIGDILIVEFDRLNKLEDPDVFLYKIKISDALLKINKSVKSVYEKKSEILGDFRLRELKLIVGFDNSETLYKENKTIYKLDVKKVFFSPRLGQERKRISENHFNFNEMIVDMFAGVGSFSIQIAKKNRVKIYAFDVNPVAFRYMEENVEINNVEDKIEVYNLDVKELLIPGNQVGKMIHNQIDRIIMNLPEMSFNFLDVTCFLMKNSGGILHFYSIAEKENAFEITSNRLKEKLAGYSFKIDKILSKRIVKAYSPKKDLIVLDCVIKAENENLS